MISRMEEDHATLAIRRERKLPYATPLNGGLVFVLVSMSTFGIDPCQLVLSLTHHHYYTQEGSSTSEKWRGWIPAR